MKQFLTSCFALCTPRFIILKVNEPATVLLNATVWIQVHVADRWYQVQKYIVDNALCTLKYYKTIFSSYVSFWLQVH